MAQEIPSKELIIAKLEEIKTLISATDTNCINYHFVQDDELPLLKQKMSEYDFSKDRYIDLSNVTDEYHKLMSDKFNFINGKNLGRFDVRNIIINSDGSNNASLELHQDFKSRAEDRFATEGVNNILYYYHVENCNYMTSGTGIFFIDNKGVRRYEILPIYPGLIVVLRDKCMFHNTPKITPIDPTKPIVRTIIRMYEHGHCDNSENCLLQSINREYMNKTIENSNRIKYIKYKTKYLNLQNKYLNSKKKLIS